MLATITVRASHTVNHNAGNNHSQGVSLLATITDLGVVRVDLLQDEHLPLLRRRVLNPGQRRRRLRCGLPPQRALGA